MSGLKCSSLEPTLGTLLDTSMVWLRFASSKIATNSPCRDMINLAHRMTTCSADDLRSTQVETLQLLHVLSFVKARDQCRVANNDRIVLLQHL
jgi:predicted RNA polymerase sigma factor